MMNPPEIPQSLLKQQAEEQALAQELSPRHAAKTHLHTLTVVHDMERKLLNLRHNLTVFSPTKVLQVVKAALMEPEE